MSQSYEEFQTRFFRLEPAVWHFSIEAAVCFKGSFGRKKHSQNCLKLSHDQLNDFVSCVIC